jgi:hypothetical protein
MKRQPAPRLPPPHRLEGSVEIRRVTLPKPHPAQQQVIDEARRYNTVVCGRRFGKTTLGQNRLILPALDGKPVAWCAPSYRMMVETWESLQHVLANVIAQRNEQEHRLTLVSGGTIDPLEVRQAQGRAAAQARWDAWRKAGKPKLRRRRAARAAQGRG